MFTDYLLNPPKHQGQNISNVQINNRKLILNLIQRHKVISRIRLAELSSLKPATITIIINEFLRNNIVEECGFIERENQRRVKGLRLIQKKFCTINIRITSSYYVVGLFDINSDCITFEKISYHTYENFSQTLIQISSKIEQFIILSGNLTILGISIGVHDSFLFTPDTCEYYEPFSPTIKRINIGDYFRSTFSYPVYIERTADFVLYWLYHANILQNAEEKIVLYLSVSTSVDMSFLHYGHIYQGAFSTADSLKNIYIKSASDGERKSVTELLTIAPIVERAKKLCSQFPDSSLAQLQEFTYHDLFHAYNSDDPLAVQIYTEVAYELSQLLIILINIFSPHQIVIGDELPFSNEFFSLLHKDIEQYFHFYEIPEVELTPIEKKRSTTLDPSLRGGNSYIIGNELFKLGTGHF